MNANDLQTAMSLTREQKDLIKLLYVVASAKEFYVKDTASQVYSAMGLHQLTISGDQLRLPLMGWTRSELSRVEAALDALGVEFDRATPSDLNPMVLAA